MEYKIIDISPIVDIDTKGRFIKKYRITFDYKNIEDFIEIPDKEYNDLEVKKRIEEKVKTHEKLLG